MNDQANFRQFRDRMANGLSEQCASYAEAHKHLSRQAQDNFTSDEPKTRRNRQRQMAFLKGRLVQAKETYRDLTGRELEI